MHRTLLASVLLVAATAVSAAADVPANASYQVRLELGDGHGAAVFDGTIAMTGDRACGQLETTTGPTRYTVHVCREGGDAANPVISVDLDRATRVDHDMRHQKMEITGAGRGRAPRGHRPDRRRQDHDRARASRSGERRAGYGWTAVVVMTSARAFRSWPRRSIEPLVVALTVTVPGVTLKM